MPAMSLTDGSHGRQYSVHKCPPAEDYKSRPVRTFRIVRTDSRYPNMSGNVTGKWPATSLWSLSKVKVVSFLMGLTLMFIVTASYLLAWDKEGFLFTASPEHFGPVVILSGPLATAAPDVPSKGLFDVKPLVRIVSSKLEYAPRTPPDEKDVFEADSRVSPQRVIHRPC